MKYIDTNADDHSKPVVLILPDNPGNSDDYLQLCYHLNQSKYRVVVPNYPRNDKVKNLIVDQREVFTTEFLANYLFSFMEAIKLKRLDFIIAHGWSGYEAIFLEAFSTSSHVLLVNFPKIFDFKNMFIKSIPFDLLDLIHTTWHRRYLRLLLLGYLRIKTRNFHREDHPLFGELSRKDLINSLLYFGATDIDNIKGKLLFNTSLSLGLINLPNYKPTWISRTSGSEDPDRYRFYLNLFQSDIYTVNKDSWRTVLPKRRKYELNFTRTNEGEEETNKEEDDDDLLSVDSELFGEFLVNWMKILGETNFQYRRLANQ